MLHRSMLVKFWSSSIYKDMLLQHNTCPFLWANAQGSNFNTMEAYLTAQETMMTDHKNVRSK